jgi:hypothetical protein
MFGILESIIRRRSDLLMEEDKYNPWRNSGMIQFCANVIIFSYKLYNIERRLK